MSANGFLTKSELAPIPGGWLRIDAAAAWNAMCDKARQHGMPVPMPDGPASSYRNFAQQVEQRNIKCAEGRCADAAVPGTSRHGKGIAVDCAEDAFHHAATIDAIGEEFGWSKKWSDAPWEPWHNTWLAGIWTPPPAPPPDPNHYSRFPAAPVPYDKGRTLSELGIVMEYDQRRLNAHLNAERLHSLMIYCEFLRKRVWIAAHPNWLTHHSDKPSEWDQHHRGWRYQQLSYRARGKRLHVDFQP